MITARRAEVEQFRDRIEAELGLIFGDDRMEQVAQALTIRSDARRMAPERYLAALEGNSEEWQQLAALLTVPESYFFRHADHLNALVDVAMPERMAAHPHDRTLRMLSAGCAGGEEPYTLSMTALVQEELLRGWEVRIRGCDLNPEVLRHAERGIYTPWALRATSPAMRQRYFDAEGKRYRIRDEVRRLVQFERGNVLHLFRPELSESFDIVFFRNVLIYFGPEAIRAAINGVAHLLAPGGYLFLGPAETLRGISDDFVLCHTHETFYYRRRPSIGAFEPWAPAPMPASGKIAAAPAAAETAASAAAPALLDEQMLTTWMEEIERSSERVRALQAGQKAERAGAERAGAERAGAERAGAERAGAERTGAGAAAPPQPRFLSRGEEIQRLSTLFSAERYGEVIAGAASVSQELQRDPDVCLLLALAHLNRRDAAAAEAACRTLLDLDSLNSSGHYVLALCREQSQDAQGAAEHDRIAIYLDPSFAMPHLHLALLARRRGDGRTARRSFEQASLLLARESASRILMFGGGFTREALCDLCRRELRALRNV